MNIKYQSAGEDGWNDFVEKSDMGSIFQSNEWTIHPKGEGWVHDLMLLEEKGEIIGGAMLYWKKIPFLNKNISKIFYGPIWNSDKNILNTLCEEIIKIGKERKAIFVEFQVHLPEYINEEAVEKNAYVHDIFVSNNFRKLPDRTGTYWIDLEKDEDDIFNHFAKNHRRDIKKGNLEGVQIKIADDPHMVDIFYEYYANLFHSKKLVPSRKDFFIQGLASLLKTNRCKLFYAEYEGTIYNMAVISLFGNPMYVWGASIRSEKKPPMGELLHWEIMKWLKTHNFKVYDLGGSPGAIPEKEHPNYWVWRFKKGFNGDYVEFLPRYRYILSGSQYWLYEKALPLYRNMLSGLLKRMDS